MTLSSHPLLINPLGLDCGLLLVEVDREVPIRMEVGPKPSVCALLAAIIYLTRTLSQLALFTRFDLELSSKPPQLCAS
jgi:hypothetical protein